MADPPRDDKKTQPALSRRQHQGAPGPRVRSGGNGSSSSTSVALRDAEVETRGDWSRALVGAEVDRAALGQREHGRVTIDFSGPPLGLPQASTAVAPAPAPRRTALTPARSRFPSVRRLGSDTDEDHDAWVVDSQRRSTVPPPSGGIPVHWGGLATVETGTPGLQHTWVSAHQVTGNLSKASPRTIELPDGEGDALALAGRPRPSEPPLDLMAEIRARFALDDLTGALHMAELLLGAEEDNQEAHQIADVCRKRLERLYTSQLGSLLATPHVDVPDTDIRWLGLDHRSGFLLSLVDGETSLEELLDLSGMPRLEALKTMLGLVDAGAIGIKR